MARNHEKHYGKLNRLYLLKEKEEYEKANPVRPRLDLLDTPEEIQKWLPSIKKDIDFYLKKSKVTCYSDAQIEDCKLEVIKLEKEFKAFVRKIKQSSPNVLDAIPWTNRPYKRKIKDPAQPTSEKKFVPIQTPLLDNKKSDAIATSKVIDTPFMNEPLCFKPVVAENSLERSSNDDENSNQKISSTNSFLFNFFTTSSTDKMKVSKNIFSATTESQDNLDYCSRVDNCASEKHSSVSKNNSKNKELHLSTSLHHLDRQTEGALRTSSMNANETKNCELNLKSDSSELAIKIVDYDSSDSDRSII